MGNRANKKRREPKCCCCCNCIAEPKHMLSEPKCSIGLIGDNEVGKTAFMERLVFNKFEDNYSSTLVLTKEVMQAQYHDTDIEVTINDMNGHEKYRVLNRIFLKRFDGIFLMYAINNRQSFEHLKDWINYIREFNEKKPIIILGNKSDQYAYEETPENEAREFAKSYSIQFYMISCCIGFGIKEALQEMLTLFYGY